MLLSELEERERRFKLALRAGIPVLILIFLVFFTTISNNNTFNFNFQNVFLIASITFITIYFIYFLMNVSVKETLVDQTTQGFNQKAFVKKLEDSKPQTLALIIIKNLSTINQNYSDREVDTILYTIIQKLNLKFQQKGLHKTLIGRRYGAEFLIALDETYDDLEKILEEFTQENTTINNIEVDYTFAIVTNTGKDFQQVILQLQDIITMQFDKNAKEKNIPVTKDATEISDMEKSIIASIKNNDLLLSFRPLLNTKKNIIDIYEIAVKLNTDKSGNILPRVYLPVINRLGLGREYDFTLLKHIIDLLPLIDKSISLTFNLSPFSLRDPSFQEKFFNYLDQKEIDPSRLIIQLYERKTHHNLGGYLKTLNKFRAKGVRICIDNFGSSNASMEYMKHFKFDMIQFDRDYVTNLQDETSYAMLESLIKMSKDLKIITVAKWVDKDTQKDKLRALGIDYLQGFGISKPITETELINRYN
ncbi:MAG: EAL domain-containing protein [Campylobacterota bacterium]|nr:EAL domain-containing protein [Campylobacterota bacterium]